MSISERLANLTVLLGKGPGYVLVALLEVAVACVIAHLGKDLSGLAYVFGAINVPFYGTGVWKAMSDNKATVLGGTNGAALVK
jgi:hypothetical protein